MRIEGELPAPVWARYGDYITRHAEWVAHSGGLKVVRIIEPSVLRALDFRPLPEGATNEFTISFASIRLRMLGREGEWGPPVVEIEPDTRDDRKLIGEWSLKLAQRDYEDERCRILGWLSGT